MIGYLASNSAPIKIANITNHHRTHHHTRMNSLKVPEFDDRQMARSPPPGTPQPSLVPAGIESPPQPPPLDDPCRLLDDGFRLDSVERVRVDRERKEIDISYNNTRTRIEINLV